MKNLNGKAHFNNPALDIYVKGNGMGHFTAIVKAVAVEEGSSLEYKIEFDQTYLPEMIVQLRQIVKERPSDN